MDLQRVTIVIPSLEPDEKCLLLSQSYLKPGFLILLLLMMGAAQNTTIISIKLKILIIVPYWSMELIWAKGVH